MAKLNSKKWKKSSFYEEKSLVGLTPEEELSEPWHWNLLQLVESKDLFMFLPPKPEGIVNNNIESFIPGVICDCCKIQKKNIRKKRKRKNLQRIYFLKIRKQIYQRIQNVLNLINCYKFKQHQTSTDKQWSIYHFKVFIIWRCYVKHTKPYQILNLLRRQIYLL